MYSVSRKVCGWLPSVNTNTFQGKQGTANSSECPLHCEIFTCKINNVTDWLADEHVVSNNKDYKSTVFPRL